MLLRSILSLVAFACVASLVWWVGPVVSIGEAQPLNSTVGRAIGVLLVALLILGPLAWRAWVTHKAEQSLKLGLTKHAEEAQLESGKLAQIFNQAISTLKTHQTAKRWYQRKAGLYELPWYVFIGPPGSGKTTALVNSGLRFPLQNQLGQSAIKGVGGTRNCDWWFSDQAVLIDTAGRFTTQDSNAHADAAGWHSFLKLLKQHRPKQPVNGILLTLSVQDLLESEEKRMHTARIIGLRLQEMIKALEVCPPVYVLVTKLDLIKGFEETFGRMTEEERAQGWGINFDHPNTLTQTLGETLPRKLAELNRHLNLQLAGRLDREPMESKRTRLFEFPNAFAQIKPPLEALLNHALQSDSPFEKPVQLRGVYFSSGTQDGTVFDRILSGLQRVSGLAHAHGRTPAHAKSFFLRRVLTDVIFAEQHVASTVKRKATLERLAYHGTLGVSGLLTLLLLGGWWLSHRNNTAVLTAAHARAEGLQKGLANFPTQAEQSLPSVLNTLDEIRGLVEPSPDSLQRGLGLNQDKKLQQAEELAYTAALRNSLMPFLAKRLEDRLQNDTQGDGQSSYESLKFYLMVMQAKHLDKKALKQWVLTDWQTQVLPALQGVNIDHALAHLDAAIESGLPDRLPPLNHALVEQARRAINTVNSETRLYQRLYQQHDRRNNTGFSIAQGVGADGAGLFRRASGQSTSEGVDSFFTRKVYFAEVVPQLALQAKAMHEESTWVLGQAAINTPLPLAALLQRTRELYLREYVKTWDALLRDVRLQNPANFDAAVELARALAAPQSPLKTLLENMVVNTKMGTPTEQQVDQYFSGINQLLAGNPPAYTQVQALLNDVYTQLSAIAIAKKNQTPPPQPEAIEALRMRATLMPEPVRGMVEELVTQGRAQGMAAERANLSADLKPMQDICTRTVAKRYPIQYGSNADILIEDFTRMFGANGLTEQFFNTRLAPLVDMGSTPWRFKQGSGAGTPAAALAQFQRATRIREVYFSGGKTSPAFEVDMKLVGTSHPNDVFYLDNHGTLLMFSMQFDPRHTVKWKPQAPGSVLKVRASNGGERSFNGPWALFRLFDTASIQTGDRPEFFKATFTQDGKRFDFEVFANSAFNPLRLNELRQFRCPGDL